MENKQKRLQFYTFNNLFGKIKMNSHKNILITLLLNWQFCVEIQCCILFTVFRIFTVRYRDIFALFSKKFLICNSFKPVSWPKECGNCKSDFWPIFVYFCVQQNFFVRSLFNTFIRFYTHYYSHLSFDLLKNLDRPIHFFSNILNMFHVAEFRPTFFMFG